MIIKYPAHYIGKLLIGIAGIIICVLTMMLFVEYRFFKQQAEKMLALKQEYQDQLVAMNKAMQEYAKTKEQLGYLEAAVDQQKKKLNSAAVSLPISPFPEGAKIFSSEQAKQEEDSFVPLNRDLSHLKKVSLTYIKEQNLHRVAHRMRPDVWQDYMQELHEKTHPARPSKKKGRSRRRRGGGNHRTRHYAYNYQSNEGVARDITFNWPINRANFWLSSFFGPRRHPNGSIGFHYGIDMAAVRGTPVHPAAPGMVVEARVAPGFGKTVVVVHTNKYKTRYAHLDSIAVRVGQRVECDSLLGKVGSTGSVRSKRGDASHLHFEVYAYGKRLNPMYFFR